MVEVTLCTGYKVKLQLDKLRVGNYSRAKTSQVVVVQLFEHSSNLLAVFQYLQ